MEDDFLLKPLSNYMKYHKSKNFLEFDWLKSHQINQFESSLTFKKPDLPNVILQKTSDYAVKFVNFHKLLQINLLM